MTNAVVDSKGSSWESNSQQAQTVEVHVSSSACLLPATCHQSPASPFLWLPSTTPCACEPKRTGGVWKWPHLCPCAYLVPPHDLVQQLERFVCRRVNVDCRLVHRIPLSKGLLQLSLQSVGKMKGVVFHYLLQGFLSKGASSVNK